MAEATPTFYVLGGTLARDAPSYVSRQADQNLYTALSRGSFCYVLTSRQMGKSSLMVRTAVRLRADGVRVAVLDLTALGQNLTPEQWYFGLVDRMGRQLGLESELEEFWESHPTLSPLQRWAQALRAVVLERIAGRVVVFVDEIDATRSLPFSADEFFSAIREVYNRRAEDPALERLTFCLLGVATPSDLVQDVRTTPFNIGERIELSDFTETEAAPLRAGLGRDESSGHALLRRVLHWTGGHPYLTQRLCQAVAHDETVTDAAGVDRVCEGLLLSTGARERDDNLLFVRDRILRSGADIPALLGLYDRIRRDKPVENDPANPLQSILRLAGIVRRDGAQLRVRNRIYRYVFDRDWVRASLPMDELARQRAAYRRRLIRVTAGAACLVFLFGSVAAVAVVGWGQAKSQEHLLNSALDDLRKQKEYAFQQKELAVQQQEYAVQQQGEAERQSRRAAESERRAIDARHDAENQAKLAKQRAREADEARKKAEQQAAHALDYAKWVLARVSEAPGVVESGAGATGGAVGAEITQQLVASERQPELDLGPSRQKTPGDPEIQRIYRDVQGESTNLANKILSVDRGNQDAKELRVLTLASSADMNGRLKAYEKALAEAKMCVEVADELSRESSRDRAQIVAFTGYAFAAQTRLLSGDRSGAEKVAARAREISARISDEAILKADKQDRKNMLLGSVRLGGTFEALNAPGRAVESYERALMIAQDLAKGDPHAQLDEAASLLHLGRAQEQAHQMTPARDQYRRSAELYEKLTEPSAGREIKDRVQAFDGRIAALRRLDREDMPTDAKSSRDDVQQDLIYAYRGRAMVQLDEGRRDDALASASVSLYIAKGRAKGQLEGPARLAADRDLMASHWAMLFVLLAMDGKKSKYAEHAGLALESAEDIARRAPGLVSDRQLAVVLKEVGRAEAALDRVDKARAAFTRRIAILTRTAPQVPERDRPGVMQNVASTYGLLGALEKGQKNTEAARQAFERQIATIKSIDPNGQQPELLWALLLAQDQLGDTLSGDPQAAKAAFEAALSAGQKLVEKDPKIQNQRARMVAHLRYARALENAKDPDSLAASLTHAEAARKMGEAMVVDRANRLAQRDLASAYSQLGSVLNGLNRPAEATEAYKKRVAVLAELNRDPENTELREDLSRVAYAYDTLGDQERRAKNYPAAAAAYRGEIEALNRIDLREEENDANRGIRDRLRLAYGSLGSVLNNAGHARDSVRAYEQARDLAIDLDRKSTPQTRSDVASARGNLSWALLFTKNAQSFQRALAEAKQALEEDGTQLWIRTNLAHAYLFTDQFDQAKRIYEEYGTQKLKGGQTFAAQVLEDFAQLTKHGIYHRDIPEAEKLLRKMEPSALRQ